MVNQWIWVYTCLHHFQTDPCGDLMRLIAGSTPKIWQSCCLQFESLAPPKRNAHKCSNETLVWHWIYSFSMGSYPKPLWLQWIFWSTKHRCSKSFKIQELCAIENSSAVSLWCPQNSKRRFLILSEHGEVTSASRLPLQGMGLSKTTGPPQIQWI